MVNRSYWLNKVEKEWREKSILWLSGVRRAGKTFLCQSLDQIEYFDCELPRVRTQLEDAEGFLRSLRGKRIVLDEIHRLQNPSELLKIAADHYSDIKILATGSSTLQASAKFKDTLTGRKRELHLTPINTFDMKDFANEDLKHRFLFGGLPPFFLSHGLPEKDYGEWIDSYWAKDIQELFRLEKHWSFKRFVELIFANSGSIFEATKYAAPCEVSRPTISNYLNVLEKTWVAQIVRPFSTRSQAEIIHAPKVYAFDTGFICYFKGWQKLRQEDLGFLWEHFVLNEINSRIGTRDIYYWRDKRGHEVDFILLKRGAYPTTIECKFSSNSFNQKNISIFRKYHPKGKNLVIAYDIDHSYVRTEKSLEINYVSLEDLTKFLN